MSQRTQVQPTTDHSRKSILARGCDPEASRHASVSIPPMIGNPEYVPTTDDEHFIRELQSRKWSVIFFAPGACRFDAANRPIPGHSTQTSGWTLEQYKDLVRKYQGEQVQIVETLDERDTLRLLERALRESRETPRKK